MSLLWVLSLCCFLQAVPLSYQSDVQCANVQFPPTDAARQVPWVTVNLDHPPAERWRETAISLKRPIQDLIGVIMGIVQNFTGSDELVKLIDVTLPAVWATLPEPYKSEILGFSVLTEIPLGRITLYNIFYEIFTVCTSVIAQDPKGILYHARNLDFGLFLGWDIQRNTWLLPPYLRKLTVNVRFVNKANETLFETSQLAGYVGVLSGYKPNAFSLTMNERFKLRGGFIGIFEWLKGNHSLYWTGFLTRHILETQTTYADAKRMLSTVPVMSPAYYILGGVNPGEACVITRGLSEPADVWEMTSITAHPWFILQTNYDHAQPLPFFDDRGTPGTTCMLRQGATAAGYASIFNVLNTVPNLNQLTVHAALMCTRCGNHMQTYLQYCPTDKYCSMW